MSRKYRIIYIHIHHGGNQANTFMNEGAEIIVENISSGTNEEIPTDFIVLALGVKPVNSLYNELVGDFENLFILGDAVEQGKIIDAVNTAHVMAIELE